MCIGSIQSNASACGGACNGPSTETRACNPKDCPGIPLVHFCDVVKMFCASEDAQFKFYHFTFFYNITSLTHWFFSLARDIEGLRFFRRPQERFGNEIKGKSKVKFML